VLILLRTRHGRRAAAVSSAIFSDLLGYVVFSVLISTSQPARASLCCAPSGERGPRPYIAFGYPFIPPALYIGGGARGFGPPIMVLCCCTGTPNRVGLFWSSYFCAFPCICFGHADRRQARPRVGKLDFLRGRSNATRPRCFSLHGNSQMSSMPEPTSAPRGWLFVNKPMSHAALRRW